VHSIKYISYEVNNLERISVRIIPLIVILYKNDERGKNGFAERFKILAEYRSEK